MYKIGTISRFLGIPEHVLRFYEKKGLIHPKRREGSSTRYYDAFDINRLVMAKRFRGLEFSIEEVQALFAREAQDEEMDYYEVFSQKYQELTQSLERLSMAQRELARLKDAFYLHEKSRHAIQSWRLPGLYWHYDMNAYRDSDSFSTDRAVGEVIMKQIYPAVYMMALVEQDAVWGDGALDYSWGTAFSEQYLHLFPEHLRSALRYIPAGEYRVQGYIEDKACMITRERMAPLKADRTQGAGDHPLLVELLPGGRTLYCMPCTP